MYSFSSGEEEGWVAGSSCKDGVLQLHLQEVANVNYVDLQKKPNASWSGTSMN